MEREGAREVGGGGDRVIFWIAYPEENPRANESCAIQAALKRPLLVDFASYRIVARAVNVLPPICFYFF